MRELQNSYLMVMLLILFTVVASTGIVNSKNVQPVPVDYLDDPKTECYDVERFYFDTPGIDPHEVKTKKECEEQVIG
jgi:hypothetical protein